jgi:predicted transposase YdaD
MLAQSEPNWGKAFREQGQQEGRQEGRQEGIANLLLFLLHEKFGYSLPDWVPEKTNAADEQTLNQWSARMLKANTLEEVFGL